MKSGANRSASDSRIWVWALAATVLMQTVAAFQTRMYPLLGPSLTEAAAIPAEYIGYLVALHSVGTIWFLVSAGDFLPRLGPLRSLQVGIALGLAGVLLVLFGSWWALVLSSILIGFGYGPSITAGSDMLMRYAPVRHRSLVFSIKQSGVPLGGAIAGATIPALIDLAGWRGACIYPALIMLAITLLLQPLRARIDEHRERERPASVLKLFDPRMIRRPFLTLRADADLMLFTIAGVCFASAQGVLFAFFVTYAMTQAHLGLAAAGLAFSTMQLAGILGRMTAGWLADRLRAPRLVLIALGVGSALAIALTALLDASWSALQIHAVAALAGGTSTSWNGVFLSDLGRLAPLGRIGELTAAVTFFIFIGYVVGPVAFGWAVIHGVSYQAALMLLTAAVTFGIASLAATFIPRRARR
jgi:MFS family permease